MTEKVKPIICRGAETQQEAESQASQGLKLTGIYFQTRKPTSEERQEFNLTTNDFMLVPETRIED